ncbi:MAG: S8 family serine peptidase, partial [Planctomycetes bacterium]|nr:S8 family serine peptidase [Planctomycetota bacterium]
MPRGRERVDRTTGCELYEDRLAMSAQPVGDLLLTPLDPDSLAGAASQIEPAAQSSNDYGVEYVRRTYGFLGAGQTVAIIDSGIAYDHAALGGGLGAEFRVVGGWDFAENDADPYDDAPAGFHGTHVAGIVGSSDPVYEGLAPGVDLVSLRVFDDQSYGEIAWVEQALRWVHEHRDAFENPITTVNLSLGNQGNGGLPADARLEDELAQLKSDGIFVVASAGNSFANHQTPGLSYPAASLHVTPAASVGAGGQLSDFSQRDSRVLAAPGERITSTVPDYAKNLDGKTNDFERASGTSMAAPFVAGAGVLLREAMLFAGRTDVTADVIHNHFRDTADLVFDAATSAPYHRIDVGRAIDAAMPADDYGSTAAEAFSLSTLDNQLALSGLLGRTDDVDYFSFVAGQSGVVHVHSQASGNLVAEWRADAGAGESLSFEVIAGRSYTVGLAATAGIGRYDASLELSPIATAVDWGDVTFREIAGESISGEALRSIRASRDGTLTVEAIYEQAAGSVQLELYDAQGGLVAVHGERIDLTATAGEQFTLKIIGVHANVDFRLTNLLSVSAGVVDVGGTSGADSFTFSAGDEHTIAVNGVQYRFDSSEGTRVRFQGAGGEDSLSLTGTTGDERLTSRPGNIKFTGDAWSVSADDVENVQVAGGGGRDEAVLHDSRGHDRLEASPEEARLLGDRFDHRVSGFAVVQVQTSLGHDMAFLADSAGDDVFTGRPGVASLEGPGYRLEVGGFDFVRAAAGRGHDRAVLHDSPSGDRFFARPGLAWITGRDYLNFAASFEAVHAYASAGGFDMAWLFDSRGDDRLAAGPEEVLLAGPGFQHGAAGFETVRTVSSSGGRDRAEFFRTPGDSLLVDRGEAILSGRGYLAVANYFSQVDEIADERLQQAVFGGFDRDEGLLNGGPLAFVDGGLDAVDAL